MCYKSCSLQLPLLSDGDRPRPLNGITGVVYGKSLAETSIELAESHFPLPLTYTWNVFIVGVTLFFKRH